MESREPHASVGTEAGARDEAATRAASSPGTESPPGAASAPDTASAPAEDDETVEPSVPAPEPERAEEQAEPSRPHGDELGEAVDEDERGADQDPDASAVIEQQHPVAPDLEQLTAKADKADEYLQL